MLVSLYKITLTYILISGDNRTVHLLHAKQGSAILCILYDKENEVSFVWRVSVCFVSSQNLFFMATFCVGQFAFFIVHRCRKEHLHEDKTDMEERELNVKLGRNRILYIKLGASVNLLYLYISCKARVAVVVQIQYHVYIWCFHLPNNKNRSGWLKKKI